MLLLVEVKFLAKVHKKLHLDDKIVNNSIKKPLSDAKNWIFMGFLVSIHYFCKRKYKMTSLILLQYEDIFSGSVEEG